jgi:hypothetical protein
MAPSCTLQSRTDAQQAPHMYQHFQNIHPLNFSIVHILTHSLTDSGIPPLHTHTHRSLRCTPAPVCMTASPTTPSAVWQWPSRALPGQTQTASHSWSCRLCWEDGTGTTPAASTQVRRGVIISGFRVRAQGLGCVRRVQAAWAGFRVQGGLHPGPRGGVQVQVIRHTLGRAGCVVRGRGCGAVVLTDASRPTAGSKEDARQAAHGTQLVSTLPL